MRTVDTVDALEALYGAAAPASLDKVTKRITPLYRQWIEASHFTILSTVGPEGTDASPRGDAGPVVRVADERTLLLPDWRGNNRIDSLRNIVRDGRASLMFLIPGCANVVRVNGKGAVTADEEITGQFVRQGKNPRTVIVLTVQEAYFQCAKAVMRSALWTAGEPKADLPSAGQFLREMNESFDAQTYDAEYPATAQTKMW